MRKYDLNVHVFQYKNWCIPESNRLFFSELWLSEDLSIGRILREKKLEDKGLISEKTEVLYSELKERAEAANGSYSVAGDFLQYIYSVSVIKNHRNIQSRCLVHEFSFTDIFNDIDHGYRAAILKKNFFVAAFILYGCGYLFLLWKGAQLQLYQIFLKENVRHF